MKKNLKILALVLALVMALAGCAANPQNNAQPGGAVTVTDMAGREITFAAAPERIVVVNPADCEILYAIGAGDAIVGRGEMCNYPEAVNGLPTVSSYVLDPESVIALSPDLVIMGPMHNPEQNIPLLEQVGIKVLISDAYTIAETYTAIELLGAATGKIEESTNVIQSMKDRFAAVEAQAKEAGLAGKTVYFEVSPLEYGLWTAGAGTFMDEFCTLLGMENAFADIANWAEVSEEQVIARDPDFIVTNMMYFGEGQHPVDEILSRTGWQGMKAVTNKDVFMADADKTSRPGPRLAEAAEELLAFVTGNP